MNRMFQVIVLGGISLTAHACGGGAAVHAQGATTGSGGAGGASSSVGGTGGASSSGFPQVCGAIPDAGPDALDAGTDAHGFPMELPLPCKRPAMDPPR
jgi:hypothetical protein